MSNNLEKGYFHIYTGDGKGKTTAAFGLAVRALCAGKKVYIGQFVKSMKYNETKIEQLFDQVKIEQFGDGCFIFEKPSQTDIDMAQEGLKHCAEILKSNQYNVVILDEVTIALYFKLFSTEELIKVIEDRNPEVEVVVTGRYAPQELIDKADLVTEMREVKHYYTQGVLSREGIDK
ncbi:cob(I)alamin adenosyltransferase [Bacteroides coprosuis DSM 18011]|uniref:corrinoid adenosyltransferase n=1 Tax=Bacteroides coprosuis DSM 18011 TaxID=679937 RepID=F3ZT73_9BACE|nr:MULTISPECIES: cob(I)yrinic acid a,c-diamide adenosyltransferase [Bacteroides]EGJ72241.1 cob(I)alamin adenosyltransferase [Bacteroides coprosuis DSM 18011]HJD91430.1 cob(I)yrinic acid a,c-diamide adenosyltransferase [Bacteroides coprosuis]